MYAVVVPFSPKPIHFYLIVGITVQTHNTITNFHFNCNYVHVRCSYYLVNKYDKLWRSTERWNKKKSMESSTILYLCAWFSFKLFTVDVKILLIRGNMKEKRQLCNSVSFWTLS